MNTENLSNLRTVQQFAAENPWVSERGLRNLIFRGEENGFRCCIRRVGRKILIDPEAVAEWIDAKTANDRRSQDLVEGQSHAQD